MTEPANTPAALLTARGLRKCYAAVVLDGIDLDLLPGEVHALVGENGAGKSTFAKILAGLVQPDGGTMDWQGRPFAPRIKAESEAAGIHLVMQELNLIPNLSIAENIFLDRLPSRAGWIDYGQLHRQATEAMREIGLGHLHPARPVKQLGVGQQQLVEIAAGLSRRCDLLILDEPTAALTDPEIELLFDQIRRLKHRGAGVLYISHRLEEIQRIADRITVLRDGRLVATHPAQAVTLDQIVREMVGRELGAAIGRRDAPSADLALRVEQLRRPPAVQEVSFTLHRGEILGFAGLMGAGRTETMRAIFAADRPESGALFLHGAAEPARIRSPRDAVQHGIALLTEDRKAQGLFLPLAVRANITVNRLAQLSRAGWIRRDEERAQASHWAGELRVRCHSQEQPILQLSGGNQQKVIIARWLLRNCDILIFDEPTRGIDVGAKFEIYQLLADLADAGKAIIVVSSDLKELLALCDRILVMSAGRVTGEFTRAEATQDKIMAAALAGFRE